MTRTTVLAPALEEDAPSATPSVGSIRETADLVDCAVCGLTHVQGTGDDPGCASPDYPKEP